MKKNSTVIIVFSCIAIILACLLTVRLVFFRNTGEVRPKIVNPITDKDSSGDQINTESVDESAMQTSFIPLLPTETLMSTLTMDFDGDNLDDQVVAVHKAGSPYLFLIVGLYNSETNAYDRVAEISTEISKGKTFSYNALDVIGNHRNALVYQGMKSDGTSVMRIYLCRHRRDSVELQTIGDFESDGTIFILQTDRSEAYALSQTKGESFSVWVYSSDKSEDSKSKMTGINQLQTEYVWNQDEQKYVQSRQLKVNGSRIAAKELARIQNGTVDTFAQFLNGLWYKTTNTESTPRYIYFDYFDKEIIFLFDDTEGVYSWEDSNLRRSGIYLTVINTVISSMKRRFDIMLSGVNEVYIHVHDDVGMVIKESNQWDGTYKKMSFQSTFGEVKVPMISDDYQKELLAENSVWKDEDDNKWTFKDNIFKLKKNDIEESGIFIIDSVGNYPIIQFRSDFENSSIKTAYAMKFQSHEVTIPPKRRRDKPTVKTVIDKDVIMLTPVRISPDTCYAAEGRMITLRLEK
ncbi:MAG: pallilysin-related adhesin [Treponema sp.]|nr:pallilysin-related adhesin [Treponema sp.]